MTGKKYLITTALSFLFGSILVIAINIVIDPFDISGFQRIPGLNEFKTEINNRVRLSKNYQPLRVNFQTLIIGNSRVEMGIDPDNPLLTADNRKAYNLGLPGAGIGYQTAAALNLIYQKPIDTVLMSLDFTDFLVSPNQTQPTANTAYIIQGLQYLPDGHLNPRYRSQQLLDYYSAFYSLNSLYSSIKTALKQNSRSADRTPYGFNTAQDFYDITRVEGAYALFDQKERQLREKYSQNWQLHYASNDLSAAFSHLQNFLAITSERNIKVYLFTNPLHFRFWDIIEENNLSPLYTEWKGMINNMIHPLYEQHVEFWDFTETTPYILERVPQPTDKKTVLDWFWEPSHYRKELGNLMLETMLQNEHPAEANFGRKIQLNNH